VNTKSKKPLPRWLPLVVGFFIVVQFTGLGVWQLTKGIDKRAERNAFHDESSFSLWQDGREVRSFQQLKVDGRYDAEHQFVLENIIVDESRYGYNIITPMIVAADAPLLLVNRGWVPKESGDLDAGLFALPDEIVTVRGRAGWLPRAGYKMGAAINPSSDWPKYAVYPSAEEIEQALGRKVQPFVLLLDPDDANGFFRHWVPPGLSPAKHFGYALQWFAMAAVLSFLLALNYRKKRFDS
tara:strand:+ start:11128 stop:11844 length:717 start_codon:yes stop_codon:yes gene_type:complete